ILMSILACFYCCFFFQAEDGIRDRNVTGVQTCALPIFHAGIELKEVRQKNRTIVQNNLPKADFNNICHIRPKARNSKDKVALPNGDKIIKQAFWLNNTYIENIIKP